MIQWLNPKVKIIITNLILRERISKKFLFYLILTQQIKIRLWSYWIAKHFPKLFHPIGAIDIGIPEAIQAGFIKHREQQHPARLENARKLAKYKRLLVRVFERSQAKDDIEGIV